MQNAQRLRTIASLSRLLRWIVWLFLATVVLVTLAVAILPSAGELIRIGPTNDEVALGDAGGMQRLTVLALMGPTLLIWMGLLWTCDRLLALYEGGVVLGRENGALIRRIGQWLLGMAALQVAGPLVAFFTGRDGSFSTSTIGLFGIGIGVLVVGHVMYLAADLAEEAELTV